MPLISIIGIISLISVWINLIFLLSLPPIYLIMKLLTKQDDFIFKLYFLKFKTFTPNLNKKYYGVKTYTSKDYRKMSDKVIFPELSILGLNQNPSFEKYIPYSSLVDDDVVISKNYELLSTWKIDGLLFEVADDENIDFHKNLLNMLFKSFASEPISFYFHSIREDTQTILKSKYKNKYLQTINDLYFKSFTSNSSKKVSLYLTVIYNPFMNNIEKSSFMRTKDKNAELKIYLKNFKEYSSKVESNLKRFNSKKLKLYEENQKDYSTQLELYDFLIGSKRKKVRALNAPINEYLIGGLKNIQFSYDLIQFNYNDDSSKFGRMIEIKDYTSTTFAGILDELMYLNTNYIITQSFSPIPKVEAKEKLKKQRNNLISADDDGISQLEQFDVALDDLTNGELCFGNYHFSLLVLGDSIKEVKANTNKVIATLEEVGLSLTLADIALPATYFSQFPCNFALRPRVSPITSYNYSDLIALHNFPQGRKDKNQWGEAVTVLKTPSKQPYFFNIHEEKSKDDYGDFTLGNFLVLGQSGGGKTAFANFLSNQLLKYCDKSSYPANIPENKKKMTLVYLDKDKGAMGNILAAGGRYLSIKNGKPTGFNPFMVENNAENKRQLQILLKILVTMNGEILSTSDERKLANAIDFVMDNFETHERKYGISLLLENLTDDIEDENSLKSRFELWQKGAKYGWVFDNEKDLLDFPDDIPIYGIDGTEFLDDPDVGDVISSFVLWRVTNLVDGRRFVLFIDEFWKWFRNLLIQLEMENKLKTIRKENGLIGLASQSVEDTLKLKIASSIIEQTSTHVFFPNPKAKKEDYLNGLGCTEEEYLTIKNFNPSDYPFLVKRKESAVVNLDLSSIGSENISILSTGLPYVEKIEEIFSQEDKTLDEKVEELRQFYRNKE